MSEFHVRVVRIDGIEKHPNADSLSITQIDGGYPVIFKTENFKQNDLAVYIPIDSVVPDEPAYSFLGGHRRIKAKKLRGIFSMGMLVPYDQLVAKLPDPLNGPRPGIGENAAELMGVVKYEPELKCGIIYSDNVPDPGLFPRYSDIEGLRKHKDVLVIGEEVVFTEKIHGANGRWGWAEGEFWVGSHNHWKKSPVTEGPDGPITGPVDIWWRAAIDNLIAAKLKDAGADGICMFGEVYGKVQDLDYGVKQGVNVRMFDAFDIKLGRYLDYEDFEILCLSYGFEMAPVLHRGPWQGFDAHQALAEGKTTVPGGTNVREGYVVRPVTERFERACGRVILKLHGQGYLLRKEEE